MSVQVIIPWRPGCPYRERALQWVANRYYWPVLVAGTPEGDPWVKGKALAFGMEMSTADVLVIADADVWCPGLIRAVTAVEAGAPWAVPHSMVCRLTAAGTAELMGNRISPERAEVEQPPYVGVEGGGMVVARREVLLDVPLDPRFEGWDQEDEAHGVALTELYGRPWRGSSPLYHLWHPPQDRLGRHRGSVDSWVLRARYFGARYREGKMREIVQEVKDAAGHAA